MRKVLVTLTLVASTVFLFAQFSPDGGQAGSTAVHPDSVSWQAWATSGVLVDGAIDIAQPSLGTVGQASLDDVTGPTNGRVVSLGDGGIITLEIEQFISDRPGPDFVVFENGFQLTDSTGFHELAFVEVSSDGVYFERFPTTSLTTQPVDGFGELQPRLVDGFAGKCSAPYGIPFDLADLPTSDSLDVSLVTHVRIIDVVGTPDTAFAKTDSDGAIVYDPYPTPFVSCGFDLDAVGVLHAGVAPSPTSEVRSTAKAQSTVVLTRDQFASRFGESHSLLSLQGSHFRSSDAGSLPLGLYFVSDAPGKTPLAAIFLVD